MFNDFKPILKILGRFLLIYLVLLGIYQAYLNQQTGLDSYSIWVADQCTFIQNQLGYTSRMVPQPEYDTSWFYINGKYISRMVEGCNAISVIILFLAFIFAFYQGLKTFTFAFLGLIFLYITNIIRIVGINLVSIKYPDYMKSVHDYIFPAIIYGGVILLWLIWIKYFVLKNEQVD